MRIRSVNWIRPENSLIRSPRTRTLIGSFDRNAFVRFTRPGCRTCSVIVGCGGPAFWGSPFHHSPQPQGQVRETCNSEEGAMGIVR